MCVSHCLVKKSKGGYPHPLTGYDLSHDRFSEGHHGHVGGRAPAVRWQGFRQKKIYGGGGGTIRKRKFAKNGDLSSEHFLEGLH